MRAAAGLEINCLTALIRYGKTLLRPSSRNAILTELAISSPSSIMNWQKWTMMVMNYLERKLTPYYPNFTQHP